MRILYSRTQAAMGRVSGGAVAHTLGVISGFSQLGELTVMTNEPLYGVDQLKQQIPVEVVKPFGPRGWGELAYNLYYPSRLSAKINEFQPDFVYHRFGGFSYATARVCKQLKVPLVLEFNSSPVRDVRLQAHSPLTRLLMMPKMAVLKWIEVYDLEAAFLIVVPGRPLRKYLLERGSPELHEERVLANPNAVDPERTRPAPPDVCLEIKQNLGIDPGKVVVGFAGSFAPWHGLPELAEAIMRLNSDPARQRQLFFALYGDGKLRPMIENLVGHYDNVLFTGIIEYAHIQDYLSICDILLSPHGKPPDYDKSIGWQGASPTKLFDYMAVGRSIVASNLDYIGQALEHGETGILIPPGDIDALVQGIEYLADHPDEAVRMGRRARQVVCERHTWEQHTRRIIEAFMALKATANQRDLL